jgi:tetratricopeptide (TPR) repeat protein
MRALRVLGHLTLAALFCSGCATFEAGRFSGRPTPEFSLTDKEVTFVQALAHYARGLILEDEDGPDSENALMHFDAAAKLDPEWPHLHAKAAAISLQRNQPEEAIRNLEESCRHNPRNLQVRVDLAAVYQAVGQLDKAIYHYKKAIKFSPELPLLYTELANTYFVKREDEHAIKILRKGLRNVENPNSILVSCYNSGVDFISSDQIPRAILCFQLIAEHHPSETHRFYQLLGELYETIGLEEEAVKSFIAATEANPSTPAPFLKLAAIYIRTDCDKSLETLKKASDAFPDNPSIFFSAGILYTSKQQFDKAIEAFEEAQQAADRSGSANSLNDNFYLHYGAACEQAEQFDKAEEVFEHCIEIYPDSHKVLNYLAYMWAEQGQELDKAVVYVQRALQIEPENGAYIDTLGWIYYKQKKYAQALELVEKADTLIKDDATITDHLGDILSAMNDNKKAVIYWRQSYIIDPDNQEVARKLRQQGIDLIQLQQEAAARKTAEPKSEETEEDHN